MTSPIPAGDRPVIPARFRIFPNYDLPNPRVEGKEVQPGSQRALMYQNSHRGFLDGDNDLLRRYYSVRFRVTSQAPGVIISLKPNFVQRTIY